MNSKSVSRKAMSFKIKLLSGKELVERGCKHDQFLPTKGPKISINTSTWLEQKQVESSLDDRKHALQQQRIEKVGSLSQATWIEEKQKAVVKEKKGPHWLHVGHTEDHELYIYPEEILHLMEMNALDLKYGDVRMSIQQAYAKFVNNSITLDEYRVYSNLSRRGYKLLRHNPFLIYSDDLDECNCSDEPTNSETASTCKNKKAKKYMKTTEAHSTVRKKTAKCSEKKVHLDDSSSDDCMMVSDEKQTEKVGCHSTDKQVMIIDSDSDNSSTQTDIVCLPSFSLKHKILSYIPNCYKRIYLSLDKPNDKYLPKNVTLTKYHYVISLRKLAEPENTHQEILGTHNIRDNQHLVRYNTCANNNQFFNNIFQNMVMNNRMLISGNYSSIFENVWRNIANFSSIHPPVPRLTNVTNTLEHHKKEPKPLDQTVHLSNSKAAEDNGCAHSNNNLGTESSGSGNSSVKQDILLKIQTLLSTFESTPLGNKSSEIKEALILAIIKFNDTFNERYTLVFRDDKCILKMMPMDEDDIQVSNSNILILSSDSDEASPPKKSLRKDDSTAMKKQDGRERCKNLRRKRKKCTDYSLSSAYCSSSSDENIDSNLKPNASRITLESKENSNASKCQTFKNWYHSDSWIRQKSGKRCIWDNYIANVGLKISSAVLASIKDLSFKKNSPIESWSQGKQLYINKITSNEICISDEEMTDENKFAKKGRLLPLLQRQDCVSIESVMKRLQIIEPVSSETDCGSTMDTSLKVSYDLYFPTDKTLRKTDLSPPPFSIIILNDETPLPNPAQLYKTKSALHKDVSLLIAIVSFDTISYVQMENITIPEMKRNSNNIS